MGSTRGSSQPAGAKQLHEYRVRVLAPTSEVDPEFLQGMANRMSVSYLKYGPVAKAYPGAVSALDSLRQRLDQYAATGNTEFLIDAANFAMIEFMHPSHPDAYFAATDSDGSPGRVTSDGAVTHDTNDTLATREPALESRRG